MKNQEVGTGDISREVSTDDAMLEVCLSSNDDVLGLEYDCTIAVKYDVLELEYDRYLRILVQLINVRLDIAKTDFSIDPHESV